MATFNDDDIVISGIGGRYPNSDHIQELMENLFNGVDMTTSDHAKWITGERDVPNKIGKMKDLDRCDAQFFGIIRKHCNSLDPVTRQFLERTLEAVIDAGLNLLDIKGSNTAVYTNCAILETEMVLVHGEETEAYGIMGRNRALNSNRLSYFLDLKGPSFSTDCFFNGGIHVLYEAYRGIKSGVIDAAIVGSGSVMIHSNASHQFKQMDVLSPDGNTRSFDADANGHARSEAVSVILMQRARDAKRCHATIVNVLNQAVGETSNLFYEPSQAGWTKVLEKFYSDSKIDPKDVAYLEADGNANPTMDEAELNAAEEVFCKNRTPDNPLLIGSVKSNLGHTEAAANMCGIAKLLISTVSDKIPKNLHYKSPNPNIRGLIRGTMKVVTEETPLNGDLVALNSFGLNGTYGHVLLRKNLRKKENVDLKEGSLPQILLVSSRHEEGVKYVLDKVESEVFDPEYASLVNNAFRRIIHGHMYRGFTVLPVQDVQVRGSGHFSGEKLPVWFIYAGMGSQWATMARDLLHLPVFKKSIDISANLLNSHGLDLYHIITHDDPTLFDNILHAFVGIVSVQIALTDVLKSIGIEPDGIIGHSVGETSASYADGCLTHEQTLLSAYYRGRASLETPVIKGMMAAIGLGYQQMKDMVPKGIEIACHNGPDSCTLSGPAEQVNEFVKDLQLKGVFARSVNVANIPYHSKYIHKMGGLMRDYLKHVIPAGQERSSRWVSTSIPESRWNEPGAKLCNAEYHINNLLSPVLFEEGSRYIPENAIVIEIAPHGLLQAILKRSLPTCTHIPLTNRNTKNQQHVLLKAIGTMFLHGIEPKVENLYPKVTYPVSRGTSFLAPLVTWDHSDTWSTYNSTIAAKTERCCTITLRLDQEECIYWSYKQDNQYVIPQVVYLVEIWNAFARSLGANADASKIEFSDVKFYNNPKHVLTNERELYFYISIQPGKSCFEIVRLQNDGVDETVATGSIKLMETVPIGKKIDIEGQQCEITKEDFYADLLHSGHHYDEALKTVSKFTIGENACRAQVSWQNDVTKLLDAMLQLRIQQAGDDSNKLQRIRKIRHLAIDTSGLDPKEVSVDLSFAPDVIRCDKVEIRDVIFESVPRNPIKFEKEELNGNSKTTVPLPSEILQVDYLQLSEGSPVTYAGSDSNKNKIMGIGEVDDVAAVLVEDPILRWQIPSAWTAEDAVSVPLNYSLAYYVVHKLTEFNSDTSVVVTDATNKLGLAILRVLLVITTHVVTIVKTDEEKLKLQAMLPKLSADNILVNSKPTGQHVCMAIKSKCPNGVNVMINTGASDIIEPSLKCLKPFSMAIELNQDKFKALKKFHNTTGFLISTSLYCCSEKNLQTAAENEKKEIKQLLEKGITSGVVVPFREKHIKDWREPKTIKLDSGRQQSNARYQCDPDKAYLILGGDPYAWISIAEWFINRKAKNIIIVHQDLAPVTHSLQKKLKSLEEKCKIVVKTAKTLSPELIDHIFTVARAKIDLTMVIPNTGVEEPQEEVIEALCKKDTFLVTVLRSNSSNALKYCQERNTTSPTLTILWNEPLNGQAKGFLQVFDRLLTAQKSQVVQVEDNGEQQFLESEIFETILPNSVEEVLEACVPPNDVKITELITMSPGHQMSREVTPFFVFPGIAGRSALVERFRESLYPVFIIDLPSLPAASLSDYAACTVPKIKTIIERRTGPFTLIGENWGGAVALEVARMLEKTGEEIQVYLIGGSPAELQSRKWSSIDDLDEIILDRIFGKTDQALSWNQRLSTHLASYSPEKEKVVHGALATIRERAKALFTTEKKEPINGTVACISRFNIPRRHLRWMSCQDIHHTVVPKSEPLLNDEVFQNIHYNVPTKRIK